MCCNRPYGNNHRATPFNIHCLTNHKPQTNNGYFSKLYFNKTKDRAIKVEIKYSLCLYT